MEDLFQDFEIKLLVVDKKKSKNQNLLTYSFRTKLINVDINCCLLLIFFPRFLLTEDGDQ